jgi:hypothetical protein
MAYIVLFSSFIVFYHTFGRVYQQSDLPNLSFGWILKLFEFLLHERLDLIEQSLFTPMVLASGERRLLK